MDSRLTYETLLFLLMKEIAKHLLKNENLHKWEFYKLNILIQKIYWFVCNHMYSFLKSENLISTYYTDATK